MKNLVYALLATAGVLACAQNAGWQTADQAQYLCGGVGDESMEMLRAERSAANLSLLFVASERGSYVADVAVSVSGAGLSRPVQFTAGGPSCLLKLPAGKYRVAAKWGNDEKMQNVAVSRNTRQVIFRWRHAVED